MDPSTNQHLRDRLAGLARPRTGCTSRRHRVRRGQGRGTQRGRRAGEEGRPAPTRRRLTPDTTKRPPPPEGSGGQLRLRVHPALRIQRTLSLRIPLTRARIRSPVLPAHERVRVVARGLQRIPVRARLSILAVGTCSTRIALGSCRSRLTLRARWTCRACSTGRAHRARLTVGPVHTVHAVAAVTPRRTARTRLPVLAIPPRNPRLTRRPRHRLTRLTTRPRRASHRSRPQPLHLPGQRIPSRRLRPQLLRLIDIQDSQDSEHPQREQARHRAHPLRTRHPRPLTAQASGPGHRATTAHTAIAADNRPISTGTIIWYRRA